jgi:hypothetical protein
MIVVPDSSLCPASAGKGEAFVRRLDSHFFFDLRFRWAVLE